MVKLVKMIKTEQKYQMKIMAKENRIRHRFGWG